MINPKSDNKVAWLASLSIILYPFLSIYGYGILNLGTIFFLYVCINTIIRKKRLSFSFQRPLIGYIFYYLLMQTICNFPNISRIIELQVLFYFVLWGFLNKEVNFRCFFKTYRLVALMNIIFFFFQEIQYFIKGYRILGIMTFLPTNIVGSNMTISEWANNAITGERSSAFFSEPAHLAQFLFPIFAMELFYYRDKNSYKYILLYFITLILLSSGNALLGCLVIFIFYIIKSMKDNKKTILIFILSLIFIIPISGYLIHSEYGMKLTERTEELNPDQVDVTSGFVRIFRGYYIWDVMSSKERIFGLNNREKFVHKRDICGVPFGEDDVYVNGIQKLLINVGYIGTGLFLLLLISMWKDNNYVGKSCVLIYLLLSFIASTLYTDIMVLYLLVALLMKKEIGKQDFKTISIKI